MSKSENVLKGNGNNSYILSSSPQTTSISDEIDKAEAIEFQKETAKYIERICSDLVVMSTRADMAFLAYLLDMARIESADRGVKPILNKAVSAG